MRIETVAIEGLCIIHPQVFTDERGYFFESWSRKKFEELGITCDFVQDNQSLSSRNVLRGLHFQTPPFAQAKLVRVIKGAVLDVAVDIRKGSPTFGKHFSIELTEANKLMFYIPAGFAHGFVTLADDTVFSYKCSNYYNKESDRTLLFNDPQLAIDWKTNHPVISEKDRMGSLLKDLVTPF
jgi:dTDP-4-dehydrorhamnose 3,5-epimerase